MPLRKTGLLSRNTGLEPSSMESVPDGLNREGYASSTSLLSNLPGRRWSIGKTVSERGVGDVDPRHGLSPWVFLSVGDP